MSLTIAIVAGEQSGDELAAGMIRAIRELRPEIRFEGVTGPKMRAAGCETLFDIDELAVMGLFEVLRHLPRLLRRRRELLKRWTSQPPAAFVGVDAPDFNLGLARRLKKAGIACAQYVCPSVWAWRESRVKTIRRSVDRVMCLLPFEPEFLARHDIVGDFVGHPLANQIQWKPDRESAKQALGLPPGPCLLLLPGSRGSELARLGPEFIRTAALVTADLTSVTVVAALANSRTENQFEQQLCDSQAKVHIVKLRDQTPEAIAAADAVLCASGTVALEVALTGRAMVVAYRLNSLSFKLIKLFNILKIKRYSLPNILAGRELVPEFIQDQVKPAAMAEALKSLLENRAMANDQISEFAKLQTSLACDANAASARVVLDMLD